MIRFLIVFYLFIGVDTFCAATAFRVVDDEGRGHGGVGGGGVRELDEA